VLSPDFAFSPLILGALFVLLLGALIINAMIKDRREFRRFTRMRSSYNRRRMMQKWLIQSFALFGTTSLVALLLAWQYIPLVIDEINGYRWVANARASFVASQPASVIITFAVIAIVIVGGVLGIVAARKETALVSIGNVQALLPRNRRELPYGAALSINAGIVEELLFRLALPAVIFGFTGNAAVAVILSVLVFGLLHAYQGILGVIGAMLVGALFMAIYLASENIFVAILAHALFDLRSLVVIPVIVMKAHRKHARS
jgi:membrane protease YdiL (CAAX protease family)